MAARFAIIDAPQSAARLVQPYLPDNYHLVPNKGKNLLIAGTDSAGWGLDDYVIPRLRTGLYAAHEVTKKEALALGFVPEPYVISNEEGLFWSNREGWGDLASATQFGRHEIPGLNLPHSSLSQWVPLADAATIEQRRRQAEDPAFP